MTNLILQIKVGKEFRKIDMGEPLYLTISSKICGSMFFNKYDVTVCLGKNDIVNIKFGNNWYTIDLEVN